MQCDLTVLSELTEKEIFLSGAALKFDSPTVFLALPQERAAMIVPNVKD